MYVCVCKAISDRKVVALATDGDVISLRHLVKSTGAGTCCGKCVPELRQMIGRDRRLGAAPATDDADLLQQLGQVAVAALG